MRDTVKSVHFESPERGQGFGETVKRKPNAQQKKKAPPVNLGEDLVKILYVRMWKHERE